MVSDIMAHAVFYIIIFTCLSVSLFLNVLLSFLTIACQTFDDSTATSLRDLMKRVPAYRVAWSFPLYGLVRVGSAPESVGPTGLRLVRAGSVPESGGPYLLDALKYSHSWSVHLKREAKKTSEMGAKCEVRKTFAKELEVRSQEDSLEIGAKCEVKKTL